VADPEHLALLRQGVEVWNAWRGKEPSIVPDLSGADLRKADLVGANFSGASLFGARLRRAKLNAANLLGANLGDADLEGAALTEANLSGAKLSAANLNGANLNGANFSGASLYGAKLHGANLLGANLNEAELEGAALTKANLSSANLLAANLLTANLNGANLSGAYLSGANLLGAKLHGAKLCGAKLYRANLDEADLSGANLSKADLGRASMVETNFIDAILSDCYIYGISAWGVKLSEGTKQQGLIVTPEHEPTVTVDDLEVAQFVYLLLHNEKIRHVIDTVGKKGVLLLGRFTNGRLAVLERLRDELRKRGYLPIVFNFDKPETKDFTETVRLLAGLSKFVIADITNPKSSPLELQAVVPEIMVPFRPIIEEGEKPFAMLQDLWIKHREWVFEPIYYSSVDALIASLDEKIIKPAEARFIELLKRKADTMGGEHV
jgi:uncharacterized protein YjbI with pentapeptide repeats